MAVDIEYRLSGGAANADPAASLGGAMSSVELGSNFWDAVSDAERVAGDTEYRCLYVINNGADPAYNVKIWIQADPSNCDHEIALGGEGLNGTAETVGGEGSAPSGESFSAAASEGAALSIGTLAAGEYYPVWEKRIVGAGETAGAQTRTLRVKYEA
jgi:hypothetical protein